METNEWVDDEKAMQIAKDRAEKIAHEFGLFLDEAFIFDGYSYNIRNKLIESILNQKDFYCLLSKNDNPSIESQEEIIKIANKYHLG